MVLAASWTGAEAEEPLCNRRTLGQTACFTAKLCACIIDRGGSITGIPPGFRWDCGVLRPSCGEAADQPVSIQEYRGTPPAYPSAVAIDRRSLVTIRPPAPLRPLKPLPPPLPLE